MPDGLRGPSHFAGDWRLDFDPANDRFIVRRGNRAWFFDREEIDMSFDEAMRWLAALNQARLMMRRSLLPEVLEPDPPVPAAPAGCFWLGADG